MSLNSSKLRFRSAPYTSGVNLRSNRGQSLVIALSVMFILVFLGTIFVTLIGRNLQSAFRSGDVLIARQMAEAGIRYADKMLTTSEEGADWRPEPDNLVSDPMNILNPDFKWLRPYSPTEAASGDKGPSGGYTSISTGSGRYLIKIDYAPNPGDPMSRYIKILSIGRVGVVDNDDPTTLATGGEMRLRQELTAYKPIAITDYVRCIFNKDKRQDFFSFGKALGSNTLTFGGRYAGTEFTGPIRVNGNLRWRGPVDLFLKGNAAAPPDFLPIAGVEVSGEIKHEDEDQHGVRVTDVSGDIIGQKVFPTYDSDPDRSFTTWQGLYRDGLSSSDAVGYARGIKRLEPPLVDQEDPTTGASRYRSLTQNSGRWVEWVDRGNRSVNSGRFGWGAGIYIGNNSDTQDEGNSVFGGTTTLSNEWTHPNNKGNWRSKFYVPPGCVIRIREDGYLDITRTDIVRGGRKFVWSVLNGDSLVQDPGIGPTITMPYPENGVVFAEGNIRISGTVTQDRQLTIVSNENIYIEGNILRQNYNNDTAAVALLARKNVVVNTTQFVSLPALSSSFWESAYGEGSAPYAKHVSTNPDSNFLARVGFGYWYQPGTIGTASDYPNLRLFMRHASSGATASIDLLINNMAYQFPGGNYWLLMSDPLLQSAPAFESISLPLAIGATGPALDATPGATNSLQIALHQIDVADSGGFIQNQSRGDYLLQAMAIQPLDINIQALLYAQEGSFFVIPGAWFNENPDDTPENMAARSSRPAGTDPLFPYYGEPLDIKITIEGAISENVPASDGAVDLWMRHWTNIPEKYGSSGEDTAHPFEGISFLYDQRMGFPSVGGSYIRTEQNANGRPLPIAPKLPCSPDLIYVGRMSS